ncbi:response regulator transcription factor [Shouchella clausii]|uniref:DNA-binding response regulator n=1 Tax=Shouchella clausii TaxID=79880 RepID=A0A268S1J8_SHOCL|nr:response regulator transcription factor [Shouchella clausii]PAD42806.1 DNA-binding response regulator [Bacillus sp. 7520-S]MEB5481363.1 response regulator transcription factor [Shouchella clausii]PAD11614.1 DNA-binding response regulator [Shouchella clausii]PAE97236.1 DNA-binding response regulator [Shouchella clausii]PAF26418.1 DNA-binding response regulator [Shouchella clausii]
MEHGAVLLVDDEQGLLDMVSFTLRKYGIKTILTATTAQQAMEILLKRDISLIVLDIMLPDGDGFNVCEQMREVTEAPILFLTAKNQDIDKIKGFELGADDYITKPFNPTEVAARVQVHLKRMRHIQFRPVYDFGYFSVNKKSGQVFVEGMEIPCAPMEFLLLTFLCEHANLIFTASELYEKVWKPYQGGDEKTVVIHISRLRKKIEPDPKNPRYLVNVKGLGYKLVRGEGKTR